MAIVEQELEREAWKRSEGYREQMEWGNRCADECANYREGFNKSGLCRWLPMCGLRNLIYFTPARGGMRPNTVYRNPPEATTPGKVMFQMLLDLEAAEHAKIRRRG